MENKKIKIFTDTCSSITYEEGKEKDIEVVPLYINDNGVMLKDTVEISTEKFYQRVKEGLIPKTTLPSIEDYSEKIEKYPSNDIVIVCPAEGLSGTYNSARLASENFPNQNIKVINTQTICASQRHITLTVKEMADNNYTIDEILPHVEEMIANQKAYMMPIDPQFLRKGGRLSKPAAVVLGFLKIIPILTLSENGGNKVERFGLGFARSMANAVKAAINNMKKLKIDINHKIYVLHANNKDGADMVLAKLKEVWADNDYEVLLLPPVLGAHAGPGTLVIQHIKKINIIKKLA